MEVCSDKMVFGQDVLKLTLGNTFDDISVKQSLDLTGYSSISFAIYTNGTPRSANVKISGTSIKVYALTQGAWTRITIPVDEKFTNLNQLSFRYHWTGYGSNPSGDVWYISDFIAIK